jgi:endonuclease III
MPAQRKSPSKLASRTPNSTPSIPATATKGKTRVAKPNAQSKAMGLTAQEIEQIFATFARANPEPKGELEHVNIFTLLVAVVLSAQATDAGVNKATRALFRAADTPQKMAALGEEKVRGYIKTIGLFRNKAKNVILLSGKLIAEHAGEVPSDRVSLEALPGVGRKTANVVLSIAFGEPTIAVDTHVFRVANRIGLSRGATPLAVEIDLMRVIPKEFLTHAHHWLILHGRYLCAAPCARSADSSKNRRIESLSRHTKQRRPGANGSQ